MPGCLSSFHILATFMGDLLKGDIWMRKKLAVIVATALLLVGCSSISSGYITAKNYEPAYSYMTQQCAAYNAKGVCTVWMPVTHYVDEKFRFDLRNDNKDTGWVYVSRTTYDQYQVGDYYGSRE